MTQAHDREQNSAKHRNHEEGFGETISSRFLQPLKRRHLPRHGLRGDGSRRLHGERARYRERRRHEPPIGPVVGGTSDEGAKEFRERESVRVDAEIKLIIVDQRAQRRAREHHLGALAHKHVFRRKRAVRQSLPMKRGHGQSQAFGNLTTAREAWAEHEPIAETKLFAGRALDEHEPVVEHMHDLRNRHFGPDALGHIRDSREARENRVVRGRLRHEKQKDRTPFAIKRAMRAEMRALCIHLKFEPRARKEVFEVPRTQHRHGAKVLRPRAWKERGSHADGQASSHDQRPARRRRATLPFAARRQRSSPGRGRPLRSSFARSVRTAHVSADGFSRSRALQKRAAHFATRRFSS